MKKKSTLTHFWRFSIAIGLLAFLMQSAAAQAPTFTQATVCGTAVNAGSLVLATAITTDTQGNVVVAGRFNGTVRFGATTLVGTNDAFVAKRDAAGTWLWAASGGGTNSDACADIALDNLGQVYVTGYFAAGASSTPSTATFGSTTLTTAGGSDVLVAKLDGTTGAWLWAQRAGNVDSSNDRGELLAADGRGGFFIVGAYDGRAIRIGATSIESNSSDKFLARIDAATGTWDWAVRAGLGTVTDLAVDAQGNGYLSGRLYYLPTSQGTDLRLSHVAKFNWSGAWQWAAGAGSSRGTGSSNEGYTNCLGLAVDEQAHLYVCGSFNGATATFGSTTLDNRSFVFYSAHSELGSVQMRDAFVARLNTQTGAWEWATRAGGPEDESLTQITVRGNRVYTSGTFGRYADQRDPPIPGGSVFGTTRLFSTGNTDIVVAGLDTDGNWTWAVKAGSAEEDEMTGLAIDAANRIHLAGKFGGTTAQFGTLSVPAASVSPTSFLAQLAGGPLPTASPGGATPFSLYPNPARSAVTVTGLPASQAVSVFDAVGRLVVRTQTPTSGPLQLILPAQLPAGVYVVQSAGQVRRLLVE